MFYGNTMFTMLCAQLKHDSVFLSSQLEFVLNGCSLALSESYCTPSTKLEYKSTSVLSQMLLSDWLRYSLSIQ